jgi:hypothetical protein
MSTGYKKLKKEVTTMGKHSAKKEKKLRLGRITLQNLNTALDKNEQKAVKGGTDGGAPGTTQVPIYCKP